MLLDNEDINALANIAVGRGLSRAILIAALPPLVQGELRTFDSPRDQLLSDLSWLSTHADTPAGLERLTRVLEQMEHMLQLFEGDRDAVRAIRLGLPAPPGHPTERLAQAGAGHAWIWLALGVGLLGGALGFVSGLSTQRGVTGDLLMALAALAAGAAVSLALVRWRRGSAPLPVAPLGVGLLLFVGLMVGGLITGIKARDGRWFASEEVVAQAVPGETPGVMRSGCEADDPRGHADGWWLRVEHDFVTVDNECGRLLPEYAPSLLVCAEAGARLGGRARLGSASALLDAAAALDPRADRLERVRRLIEREEEAP